MLTWKRPQKHHHAKEPIFPVILRYRNPKSVHGARRNLRFCMFFFVSLFCKSFYLQKLPNRQLTICKSFTYKKKGMNNYVNLLYSSTWSASQISFFVFSLSGEKNMGLGSRRIEISVNTKCFSDQKNMIYKKKSKRSIT